MIALQKPEQLNPQDNQESSKQFLSKSDWTDSTFDTEARKVIGELLVEFLDIVATHRFDKGIKNDFKVKLTPIDESPAYSQNFPTPVNLKEDITFELALLLKHGTLTTLPFKYASPTYLGARKTER